MTVTRDEQAEREPPGSPDVQPHADPLAGDPLISRWSLPERWAVRFLYLFALIPLALVAAQAVRAPRQHVLLDYWHVLAKITNDDGSLILGQVFSYHLEQPFVVPSLVFWADARFFGGDNRVLTLLAVVLVAAIVVMLRLMLPAGLSTLKKAALTVGFAFALLTSHAAEVWLQGTNGISWTPALFFSVLALLLIQRGRFWPALAAATVACLCFGAAFPVWPALALVAWLRREPVWKAIVPLAVGLGVFVLWFATRPTEQHSLATSAFDPDRRMSVMAAVLGGLWSSGTADIAIIAGGILAAVLLLLAWTTIRRRVSMPTSAPSERDEAGWVGLAVLAMALAIMLGLGRTTSAVPGGNVGLISRYVLIAALATCAALALITLRRPNWPTRYVVAIVLTVGLVTHGIGAAKQGNVRGSYAPLGIAAVALRVEATTVLNALQIQPGAIPAAKAMRAYPFNDNFTLGCGGRELGERVELGSITSLPGPETTGPTKGVIDTAPVTGDALLSGWAVVDGKRADCVLVVDTSGVIVGGGITSLTRPDAAVGAEGETGWRAVAEPVASDPTIVVSAAGSLYQITAMAQR